MAAARLPADASAAQRPLPPQRRAPRRPSGSCRSPATAARARFASGTAPRRSCSSTSTASCSRRRGSTPSAGGARPRPRPPRLAAIADLVCGLWREPDSGIWEVRSDPRHFTQSKMMCWVALDRACALADAGHIPAADATRWRRESDRDPRNSSTSTAGRARSASYTAAAGAEEVDARLLLGDPPRLRRRRRGAAARHGRRRPARARARARSLHRYSGDDGLPGRRARSWPARSGSSRRSPGQGRVDEAVDADGGAGRARKRRRPLRRGDRPARRRLPRQLPAGPRRTWR